MTNMDQFARDFIARLRQVSDDDEIGDLVSEIYENGFEDGYNEKDKIDEAKSP